MNMDIMNRQEPNFTMSSREIVHLCETQHKHILRNIEKMLQDIADPRFGVRDFLSSYTDSTGRKLKEYRLPKDLTITLITGYRADLRYRVLKRLEEPEKENQAQPAMLSGPQLIAAALIEADIIP
jgi:phage regulator Rha-like protein